MTMSSYEESGRDRGAKTPAYCLQDGENLNDDLDELIAPLDEDKDYKSTKAFHQNEAKAKAATMTQRLAHLGTNHRAALSLSIISLPPLWLKLIFFMGTISLNALSLWNHYHRLSSLTTTYNEQMEWRRMMKLPPCASSWDRFERNRTFLTKTQVIHRNHPPPKIDASMINKTFDHFFIDPDTNFAFCIIEKNACSQWQTVLHNVIDKQTENGHSSTAHYLAPNSLKRRGIDKLKQIL